MQPKLSRDQWEVLNMRLIAVRCNLRQCVDAIGSDFPELREAIESAQKALDAAKREHARRRETPQ